MAIRRGPLEDVTLVLYKWAFSILSEFKTMKSKKDVHPTNSLQHPLRRRMKGALFFILCTVPYGSLCIYVFGEITGRLRQVVSA